jgi:predicted DNA-binding transcriptional regulator YafY
VNRIDRLVAILIHLQGRRVTRAEEIADEFQTSVRTVYRDIAATWYVGWLLSFGERLVVVEPEALRTLLAESARITAQHHEASGGNV